MKNQYSLRVSEWGAGDFLEARRNSLTRIHSQLNKNVDTISMWLFIPEPGLAGPESPLQYLRTFAVRVQRILPLCGLQRMIF